MGKRVTESIWMVSIIVTIVISLVYMVFIYSYFSSVQLAQLKAYANLIAVGVEENGKDYLMTLSEKNRIEEEAVDTSDSKETKDLSEIDPTLYSPDRATAFSITWIDDTGKALYDSNYVVSEMENLYDRPEVKDAFENGNGVAKRYSDTYNQNMIFYAEKLNNNTVIRLSCPTNSIWTLLHGLAEPTSITLVIAIAVSILVANIAAFFIMRKIKKMNPLTPEEYINDDFFKEMKPLLEENIHMRAQVRRNWEDSRNHRQYTEQSAKEVLVPITEIRSDADAIINGSEDNLTGAYNINEQTRRLANYVDNLKIQTLLDHDDWVLASEVVDLVRVTNDVVNHIQRDNDSKISVNIDGELSRLKTDPELLRIIVFNLIQNAFWYNKDSGNIDIKIQSRIGNVTFTISDTGIGIAESEREKVFERFYRVDEVKSREKGGTGLGLSIVKQAVSKLGATMVMNSKPNIGTTFTVVFPKSR